MLAIQKRKKGITNHYFQQESEFVFQISVENLQMKRAPIERKKGRMHHCTSQGPMEQFQRLRHQHCLRCLYLLHQLCRYQCQSQEGANEYQWDVTLFGSAQDFMVFSFYFQCSKVAVRHSHFLRHLLRHHRVWDLQPCLQFQHDTQNRSFSFPTASFGMFCCPTFVRLDQLLLYLHLHQHLHQSQSPLPLLRQFWPDLRHQLATQICGKILQHVQGDVRPSGALGFAGTTYWL